MRRGERNRLPVVFGLFFFFVAHIALFKGFIVDDAFITFRYVQQWVHGHGLVYNIGERVEGYSNFLWILLLAPFAHLGIELTLAAKGLGVLLGLLTLYLTWRAARQAEGPEVAPFFLVAAAPFAAWTMGGLETLLFTFLLLLSGYIFLEEEAKGKGYLSGFLFGLLALSRPEGLLFALVAAGFRVWQLYRLKFRPARRDLLRLLSIGAVVVPFFLWRWTYYGYPLPNTVYAKSLGLHPRAFLEGLFYLYQTLHGVGGVFFVGLLALFALTAPNPSQAVLFWSLSLGAYALFIVIGGGDWMSMQRFAVHILPPLCLVLQAGWSRLRALWHPRRGFWLALLLAGQIGYLLGYSLEQRFLNGTGNGPLLPQDSPAIAYLRQHVQPGETIAVIDAGLIAYRLPLEVRVVDMVGLTDAHIAHQPVQLPGGLWGRGDAFGKWDVDYILAQQPRFVQVNIIGETADGGWMTNFTGTTLLVNDPRFRQMYRLVDAPGVSGIFARRDEP
jgi:arabinofuranosyltransferase